MDDISESQKRSGDLEGSASSPVAFGWVMKRESGICRLLSVGRGGLGVSFVGPSCDLISSRSRCRKDVDGAAPLGDLKAGRRAGVGILMLTECDRR